jgi:hypothetical protein
VFAVRVGEHVRIRCAVQAQLGAAEQERTPIGTFDRSTAGPQDAALSRYNRAAEPAVPVSQYTATVVRIASRSMVPGLSP